MRSLVLLPVAVLAVLGAFANASLRQPYELTGGAPVLGLAARVADELDAVRVTTNDHSLAAGNPGKGIAADTLGLDFTPATDAAIASHAVANVGFVFVVHAHRTTEALTRDQVAAIYRGDIDNWRQLGGPDAPIRLLHASTFAAAQVGRYAGLGAARAQAQVCGSDYRCECLLTGDPFALGCMSATSAQTACAGGAPLRILTLDGVAATPATIADHSYPLCRTLYLLFPRASASIGQHLIDYLRSASGAGVLRQNGFEPAANG
jgi:phosphate transport system substrate-binding protein